MFKQSTTIRWSFLLIVSVVAVFSLSFVFQNAQGQPADKESKLLRHVVMFQFKSTSSEADIQKIVDEFRALPGKIPQVADFEYGTNNSPEPLADGLTHVFLVTFHSEADRAAYLPHAAHLAFVDVLKPHLEKATVVDYWATK